MLRFHFKKIQRLLSWKQLMFLWYRSYKVMFFFGFTAVLCLGGYFWYSNLYEYHWSDERKNAFIEERFKATAFKEQVFDEVVMNLKDRARRHQEPVPITRDIFSGRGL